MKKILFLIIAIILIAATRGHNNWLTSMVHLPDFTLPALLIAGAYHQKFWVATVLIISAIAVDNYTIVHQGVSANCITPAYSILPFTYYGIFWVSQYLTSLKVDANIIKNTFVIIVAVSVQWFIATLSYYAFTASPWAKFPAYLMQWSIVEIPPILGWMVAVIIIFTLAPRFFIVFGWQKSAR